MEWSFLSPKWAIRPQTNEDVDRYHAALQQTEKAIELSAAIIKAQADAKRDGCDD